MEYRVTYFSKSGAHSTSISRCKFEEAKRIKEVVVELLGLEENFNILLGNYVEFERELLDLTLGNALSFGRQWSEFVDALHTLNRRLVNLLTTCKLYLDHLHHILSDLVRYDHDLAASVRQKCSHEYDGRFGYRVMEALRNHVQHRSLPIHSINYSGRWRDDWSARQHTATVFIDPRRLADDPKFKKSVLRELEQLSEVVDLKPFVREYVTGIVSIHQFVRDQLKEFREQWDGKYQELIASLTPESESATTFLLRAVNVEGSSDFEFSLLNEIKERRLELERKNRSFGDLTKLII